MTPSPTPPVLDEARRAELVKLAEAAKDFAILTHAPRWYNAAELSGDTDDRMEAAFIAACSPDVILALCAALPPEGAISYNDLCDTYERQLKHTDLIRTSLYARIDALQEQIASLRAALEAGEADTRRLDAISKAGATTRVYRMAKENRADPPMVTMAECLVPGPGGSSCGSARKTLRQAIDAAAGLDLATETTNGR